MTGHQPTPPRLSPAGQATRPGVVLGLALTEFPSRLWLVESQASRQRLCCLSLPDFNEIWSGDLEGTSTGPNTGFLRQPITKRLCILSPNEDTRTLGWELSESNGELRVVPMPNGYESFVEYAWNDGPRSFLKNGDGDTWRYKGPCEWELLPPNQSPAPFSAEPLHVWHWKADGDGVYGLWRNNGNYCLGFMETRSDNRREPKLCQVPWRDATSTPTASDSVPSFSDFLAGADSGASPTPSPDRFATDLALAPAGLFVATPRDVHVQIGSDTWSLLDSDTDESFAWIESTPRKANGTLMLVTCSTRSGGDGYHLQAMASADPV